MKPGDIVTHRSICGVILVVDVFDEACPKEWSWVPKAKVLLPEGIVAVMSASNLTVQEGHNGDE